MAEPYEPAALRTEGEAEDPFAKWEQIADRETLWKGLQKARSYVDHVLILHRIAQLNLISRRQEVLEAIAQTRQRVLELEAQLGDDELAAAVAAAEEELWARARKNLQATWAGWEDKAVQRSAAEHPEVSPRLAEYQDLVQELAVLKADLRRRKKELPGWQAAAFKRRVELLTRSVRAAEKAYLEAVERVFGKPRWDETQMVLTYPDAPRELLEPYREELEPLFQQLLEEEFEHQRDRYRAQVKEQTEKRVHKARKELIALQKQLEILEQEAYGRPSFEAQPAPAALARDVRHRPGHLRAVFLQGSLLDEHLAYVEWSKGKIHRSGYWQCINRKAAAAIKQTVEQTGGDTRQLPPELRPARALSADEQRAWLEELEAVFSEPIQQDGPQLTETDVLRHLNRHAPTIYLEGRRAGGELVGAAAHLAEQLRDPANHFGKPSLQPREVSRHASDHYRLLGEVRGRKRDRALTKKLQEHGAVLTDNDLKVPDYASWATIQPGKRLTLQLPDGPTVHYIPHRLRDTVTFTAYQHQATLKLEPDKIKQLKQQLRAGYRQAGYLFKPEEHGMVVEEYPVGHPEQAKRRLWVRHQVEKKHPERWKAWEESAANGTEITVEKPKGETVTIRARHATPQDMDTLGAGYYTEVEDGLYATTKMAERYHTKLAAFGQLLEQPELKADWKHEVQGVPAGELPNHQLLSQFIKHAQATATVRWMLQDLYQRGELDAAGFTVSTKASTYTAKVTQDAPNSEKGRFIIEGAHPGRGLQILEELGIAQGVCEQVPYELIYRDRQTRKERRRYGRVIPLKEEYAAREREIRLPEDHMVIHGTTGVASAKQALTRLESIHAAGGIKSIAERRRQGIGVESMSPKGDIASGIDMAVPCKIGSSPSYGSYIFYGMRPQILQRRDVFFSNQDFGGGYDRFPQYQHYAKSIGQTSIYTPPSHEARVKHLSSGLGPYNEAWFRHEIGWEDVDTIFCSSDIYPQVLERVKKWKKDGSMPEHVRVQKYSVDPGDAIAKRARQLNRQADKPSKKSAAPGKLA